MKMHYLAGAAATVLTFAVAAPASAQVVTQVEGAFGILRDENSSNEHNITSLSAATAFGSGGPVSFQLEGIWSEQDFDGVVQSAAAPGSLSPYGTRSDEDVFSVAGSIISRGDMWSFGGTALYADFGEAVRGIYTEYDPVDPPVYSPLFGDVSMWEGSLFAQRTGENFTLTGRAGYGSFEGIGGDADVRSASFNADFFVNDNTIVRLNTRFHDVEGLNGEFGVDLGFEWKPMNVPVGLFASTGFLSEVTTIQIGLRGLFGADTLRERSQEHIVPPIVNDRVFFVSPDETVGFGLPEFDDNDSTTPDGEGEAP